MGKQQLKRRKLHQQNGLDELSGAPLAAADLRLIDTDRRVPKAEGGVYTDEENVRVLDPVTHMERHGILRRRSDELDALKAVFDDRVQTMKLQLKINNQILALKRRVDHRLIETEEFLHTQMRPIEARLRALDKAVEKALASYTVATGDPLVASALGVRGIGPITVAALTVYVDLEKAPNASSLWQYVGLDRPSHQRYERNPEQQARRAARGAEWYGSRDAVPTGWGGNKVLRTVLYNTACVQVKDREAPYRTVYDRVKLRLANSRRVVTTRNTQGASIEAPWCETKPSHRHGAALRAVMKAVLADYWFVGRTLRGLKTRPPYVVEKLGHEKEKTVDPRARGWKF